MPDADASTVAHDLRLAVGRLARRLRQLYAQRSGDQLTFTELAVLSRLHRDGPASARQLANGERVTAQAVGAAIGALHQRALVERTADTRDRRKTIMSLTDPGRSAFTVHEQTVIDRMVQAVASGYTAAERRQLGDDRGLDGEGGLQGHNVTGNRGLRATSGLRPACLWATPGALHRCRSRGQAARHSRV